MSLKPTGTPPHSTQTDADVIVELYSPPRGKSSDREECLGLKRPSQWNFLDFLSFSWMNRIVPLARSGTIAAEQLPLPEDQVAEKAFADFEKNWNEALLELKDEKDADGSLRQPSLLKVLIRTYGKSILLAGFYKLLWSIFVIMGAYYFTKSILTLIRTLEGKENSMFAEEWQGWILVALFFVDAWLLGIALQRMGFVSLTTGLRARAALIKAVTRRCLSMAHLDKNTAAAAINFVSLDINKIYEGFQEIHYLWGAPVEAAAILILLGSLVGIYCLPAVGVIGIVLPLQYYFGLLIVKNKKKNAANIQERFSYIQEVLPAMKLVKYYAWERFFEGKCHEARTEELKLMFWNAVIKTVNIAMVFGTPPLVCCVVLIPYELTQKTANGGVYVTSTTIFVMLSLFNILRFPLVVLPKAIRAMSEALNAIANLQKFLAEPIVTKQDLAGSPGVSFKEATFQHSKDPNDTFKLQVPEFSIQPGQLVAVVGQVGAGKSSLLQAILGNMELVKGEGHAAGVMSYVPQVAWCQNSSLRDNIMFGQPFDQEHYNNTIHACALEMDLEILPNGDQSKAGLRGINLSGGQRQRLNLARCAYFGGDLVLLDNALSAVDHHTAHHIFDKCIKKMFAKKAVVLVTHQVEFLPQCDKVVILDKGNVVYFGPWNDGAQQILSKYLPTSHLLASAGAAEQPKPKKGKAIKKAEEKKDTAPKGATKEHSASLTISAAIIEYGWEARWWLFCLSFLTFMATQTSRQMADFFIRWWTSDSYAKYKGQCTEGICYGNFYAIFYATLTGIFLILMLFRGAFLYLWALGASQRIHEKSVHRILYAPLGFFFSTPVGDLLVSFSKDQDTMDEVLPDAIYYAGIYGLILVATTVTVSVTITLFSVLAGTLFLVSGLMLFIYLPAATHLKKLRMGAAGDLVTLVSESLDGLVTIQAYNKQGYFESVTSNYIDLATRTVFGSESLNLWLAFFCDFFGAALVLAVAAFGVGQWKALGSSAVGLAFSQSIQMLVFYTWSIRLLADSIGLFGSVEKLSWIANHTPQEGGRLNPPAAENSKLEKILDTRGVNLPPAEESLELEIAKTGVKLPQGWPRTGTIQYDKVVMKYAPHLPPALRGVTFTIKCGEKVGVVGRTGSGKSTLLLALYRMFNLESGSITVDGVDTSKMTLTQLRRGLSIIPQEPVVFSGTVRSNLDPFNEYGGDAALWEAIRDCELEAQVKRCGGLDGRIDGTGGNAWSLGQQQLMCLARAALKKVPILCMDEATAAMDPNTEAYVLEIIERLFADRTTLTIAHRLDNVIRSDQVIVMDQGVVGEIGAPSALLANSESAFSSLVDATGVTGAAALRKMAGDFYEERAAGMQVGAKKRPSFEMATRISIDKMIRKN